MRYEFPDTYGDACVIVAIDKSLLPLVSGALKPFEKRYTWLSDADYEQGYNAFAQLQASFMNNCLQELVESNRQIYRLLDTALNGVAYVATAAPVEGDPPVITPAIPDAPSSTAPAALGAIALRRRVERLIDLVDNGINGTVIDAAPTLQPSLRDNLEAIRALVEASGTNSDDIEGLINLVLLALA